jgi:hypothetical protein
LAEVVLYDPRNTVEGEGDNLFVGLQNGKCSDLWGQGGRGFCDSLAREWNGADILQPDACCCLASRISRPLCLPLEFPLAHARGQDLTASHNPRARGNVLPSSRSEQKIEQ